jgi:hypothetical protein
MYTTHYTDDEGNPQVLVVNGETGAIHGPRLASRQRGGHTSRGSSLHVPAGCLCWQ